MVPAAAICARGNVASILRTPVQLCQDSYSAATLRWRADLVLQAERAIPLRYGCNNDLHHSATPLFFLKVLSALTPRAFLRGIC